MSSKSSAFISVLCGCSAALCLGTYFGTPQLENVKLIKNEAAYVQEYNGKSPAEALEHALESIEAVRISNPDYQEDIMGLEDEIMQYQSALEETDNEIIYPLVLDAASDSMALFAYAHTKSQPALVLGLANLGISGLLGTIAIVEPKYKS